MVVRGLIVYPVILRGWSSNCKYRIFGSLRAVAQTISYEIRLFIIVLRVVWFLGGFRWAAPLEWRWPRKFFGGIPILGLFYVSVLAERNRRPYDFAEGESELVSGFNTEYRSGGFTLIFISEYLSIVFMSLIVGLVFFVDRVRVIGCLVCSFVGFVFVWVRGRLPRLRYDKLMEWAWKVLLPVRLFYLVFYYWVGAMIFII